MTDKKVFVEFTDRGTGNKKTNTYDVMSKATGCFLGRVYFRPQWRKYVFEPAVNTLYDAVCMAHIAGFIDAKTDEWRSNIITQRANKISRRKTA